MLPLLNGPLPKVATVSKDGNNIVGSLCPYLYHELE